MTTFWLKMSFSQSPATVGVLAAAISAFGSTELQIYVIFAAGTVLITLIENIRRSTIERFQRSL